MPVSVFKQIQALFFIKVLDNHYILGIPSAMIRSGCTESQVAQKVVLCASHNTLLQSESFRGLFGFKC